MNYFLVWCVRPCVHVHVHVFTKHRLCLPDGAILVRFMLVSALVCLLSRAHVFGVLSSPAVAKFPKFLLYFATVSLKLLLSQTTHVLHLIMMFKTFCRLSCRESLFWSFS